MSESGEDGAMPVARRVRVMLVEDDAPIPERRATS